MKILLAYPPCLHPRVNDPDAGVVPMGLYYVAASLIRDGHEVRVENLHHLRNDLPAVQALLQKFSPQVVGLSVFNANRWGAVALCRLTRKILPGARTVLGGVGATFLWHFFLSRFPEIDYVIQGEGEQAMSALIRSLEKNMPPNPDRIPGLALRGFSGPKASKPGPLIRDLDSLPDPADHFSFHHLALSRGCPGRCTFCGSPRFWHGRVRFHSPRYLVDQLAKQVRKGQKFFYISDDTFTLDRNRAIEVCKKIIDSELDIRWFAISRADRVDVELLAWMRRAGCIQISYGVESGNDHIRNMVLGKKIARRDIIQAFAWTQAQGILARAYFIYGSPGETETTIRESIELMHELRPLAMVSYTMHLYPGTQMFDDYARKMGITDEVWTAPVEDLLLCTVEKNPGPEKVMDWGRRLRRVWHQALPEYAKSLEFSDDPELLPFQARLCSRFALTLISGDLSNIDEIPDKPATAEHLFLQALDLAPHVRAYLGLGMLWQQQGKPEKSRDLLDLALKAFPEDRDLSLCQAVNHLHLGAGDQARELAGPYAHTRQGAEILRACSR